MSELAKVELESFEDDRIRVHRNDGRRCFVLTDVCKSIEISNSPQVASRLDDDEKYTICLNDSMGRPREVTVITLEGLLNVCGRSDKPKAKRLSKWGRQIAAEVIETGKYSVSNIDVTDPKQLAFIASQLTEYVQVLLEDNKEIEKRAVKAENEVVKAKPKADFFDKFAASEGLKNITDAANGLDIPRTKFIDWLIVNDYLYRNYKEELRPYAPWLRADVFRVKQTTKTTRYGYDISFSQIWITPIGFQRFANKLHKEEEEKQTTKSVIKVEMKE